MKLYLQNIEIELYLVYTYKQGCPEGVLGGIGSVGGVGGIGGVATTIWKISSGKCQRGNQGKIQS
jgi:hypothetical protein